ncbi:hypothetical protein Tco_0174690 [Tanacetum coccineum]
MTSILHEQDFITAYREKDYISRGSYRSLGAFVGGRRSRILRLTKADQAQLFVDIEKDTYPILLSFTHCGNKTILRVLCIVLMILPEHPSEMKIFTMKMEILLEPTSNKLLVESFKDGDGNGVSSNRNVKSITKC